MVDTGLPPERKFWRPAESLSVTPIALAMVRAPAGAPIHELGELILLAAALITALQDAPLDPRERAMAITHVQTAALIVRP